MRVASGNTTTYAYFVAVDATDYVTRETGLASFTVYRSRNGAAAAAMTTPTINETDATNMPGVYELLLDEDTTIDSGFDEQQMVFHVTHAGMSPVTISVELFRPKYTEGSTLTAAAINAECDTALTDYDAPTKAELDSGLAALNDLDAAGIRTAIGLATANLDTQIGTLATASALATVDTEVGAIQTDLDNATDGLGAIKAAVDAIPTSNPTAAAIADAVWTEAIGDHSATVGSTAEALDGASAPTAAAVADAVWDEVLSGHLTAGTTGASLNAAGSAGDPWTTTLPGSYTGSQAGKMLSDILTDTAEIGAAGAGLTAVPWNSSWDAEVQSEVNDALVAYSASTLDAAGIRTAVGLASADLDTQLAALPTALENADALLNRDMSAVSDTTARSPLNALRFLRNKWSVSGAALTVTKEDDSTSAWTATLTSDASANPVTGSDPA